MSLNRVTLICHLGQNPELRHLPTSGHPVAFRSRPTRRYTDKQGQRQERTDWHHIVVFGKAAERCKEYMKQGREVYVEGRLRTREYEARNNDGQRQRTEIIAQRVQFLGTPPADTKSAEVSDGEPTTDEVPF